jgi:hypothetical protein
VGIRKAFSDVCTELCNSHIDESLLTPCKMLVAYITLLRSSESDGKVGHGCVQRPTEEHS